MRDQFVGDIGDFAKYGLLRALVRDGVAARRLGVVWYTNKDDLGSSHGGDVSYLNNSAGAFSQCDPELYKSLRSIVRSGRRRISTVEESALLGANTPFWSEPHQAGTPSRLVGRRTPAGGGMRPGVSGSR